LKNSLFNTPQIRLYEKESLIEYKIQYKESDLNFIHRVLSDAGIYYFFIHDKNKHIMILADAPASHPKSVHDQMEYLPSKNLKESHHGYMTEWSAI
ncbi:type VI secretion system tip protein VgrG, partial [Escherichia coli]|uniref:contractile injection system protein, VgrG/Pvc8 family n=1 Tax=Escherichia coli TaxID=562 RepID=UPI00139D85AE